MRILVDSRCSIALATLAAVGVLAAVGCSAFGGEEERERDYSPYGRVMDESGKPVSGAKIMSTPVGGRGPIHAIGVVSGADGRFVDSQIYSPGRFRITVSAEGFRDRSEVVRVREGGWDGGELEFILQRE